MGAANTSISGSEYETQVILNVYDLTPLNNYIYWFGCGIFHSGIEGLCHTNSFITTSPYFFPWFQFVGLLFWHLVVYLLLDFGYGSFGEEIDLGFSCFVMFTALVFFFLDDLGILFVVDFDMGFDHYE